MRLAFFPQYLTALHDEQSSRLFLSCLQNVQNWDFMACLGSTPCPIRAAPSRFPVLVFDQLDVSGNPWQSDFAPMQ